jgi:hypothetical protein
VDRDKIKQEAEEAEAELERLRLEQEQAEADKLAREKAPIEEKEIGELFPEIPATAEIPEPGTAAAVPVPVPGDQATEIARLTDALAKSEARFQSTFGNFNKAGFEKLTQEIADLKVKLEAKETVVPPAAPEVSDDLAELTENVGAKGASIIVALQKEIASLKTTITEVTGEVKATGEKAGQLEMARLQDDTANYYSALATACPDWENINGSDAKGVAQDPLFTQFVLTSIPGTPYTYDDMLKAHHKAGKADKVAEIFNLFKKSIETAVPGADPAKEVVTEPTRTGGGAPPPQPKPQKRIYTEAQIEEFDRLDKAGKLKGTPEEIQAVKDDILDAYAQGRVRG